MKDELKEKAEKLGITIEENTKEEDIEKAISAKEKEIEDKAKENDIDHWKEEAKKYKDEAKKAYESRDTSKGERRKLQTKIDELTKKVDEAPKSEDVKALKADLKELTDFKKEVDEKREAEELKDKTDAEKAEARMEKFEKEMNDKFKTLETTHSKEVDGIRTELNEEKKLSAAGRTYQLENEIRDVAAKLKAYNPAQIVRILKSEFEYNKDLEKYEYFGRDSKGEKLKEKTVDERVTEFLEDEENDNLIKSDANTAGMQTGKTTLAPGKTTTKSPTFGRSEKEELAKEAENKGLSVEDTVEINKIRDEKLQKIKDKKEEQK